jgi:hypothetical protein
MSIPNDGPLGEPGDVLIYIECACSSGLVGALRLGNQENILSLCSLKGVLAESIFQFHFDNPRRNEHAPPRLRYAVVPRPKRKCERKRR